MIRLRELSRSDLPAVNRWRRDPELIRGLMAPFRHIDEEIDARWYDAYLSQRGSQVRCAICLEDSSEAVGLVSLTGIEPVHRSAELHILLGAEGSRGRGIGTRATRLMLRHAFEDLNLNRVWLTVLPENQAAVRLYRKLGFREEGRLRQAAFKQGDYRDLLLMGLLRGELTDPEYPAEGA